MLISFEEGRVYRTLTVYRWSKQQASNFGRRESGKCMVLRLSRQPALEEGGHEKRSIQVEQVESKFGKREIVRKHGIDQLTSLIVKGERERWGKVCFLAS